MQNSDLGCAWILAHPFFYDFQAEYWIHYPVDQRYRVDLCHDPASYLSRQGCLTRARMLAMIFKLAMSAEQSWKRLHGVKGLAKAFDRVKFRDGIEACTETRSSHRQADNRAAARSAEQTPDFTVVPTQALNSVAF